VVRVRVRVRGVIIVKEIPAQRSAMHFVRTCFEKEYDFFFTSIDGGHRRHGADAWLTIGRLATNRIILHQIVEGNNLHLHSLLTS